MPAQEATAGEEVIRVETNFATATVVVTDKQGRRVSGLKADDFAVRDGGRAVRVDYFTAGVERVALLYLLDASGSARDIITQQQETALALFSRFGRGSRISVIHFRERPEIILPFSAKPEEVRAAFRVAPRAGSRTAIFDAALAAVRAFGAAPPPPQAERRLVVLLTDGLETAGVLQSPAVIEAARAAGVSFYIINFPLFVPRDGRLQPRRPSRGLRELAAQTGGRFFTVGDAKTALDPRAEYDLRPVFEAIADDLRGQYVIGVYRREAEPRARPLEIRLAAPTERGYRVTMLHHP